MRSDKKPGEVAGGKMQERSLTDQTWVKLESMKESKKGQREFKIAVKWWDKPLLQAVFPDFAEAFLSQNHLVQIFKTVLYFCDGRPHVAVFSCYIFTFIDRYDKKYLY